MSRPTIEDLTLLHAVHTGGGIGRGARSVGISQPAASERLRRLQEELGLALTVRTSQGTTLTDEGLALVEGSRAVLTAYASLQRTVGALRREDRALQVAASQTVGEHLFSGWLARAKANDGADEVVLRVCNSAAVCAAVVEGSADIGFVESNRIPMELDSQVVAHDELVAVVHPGHRWAEVPSVDLADLSTEALIVREAGSGTREYLEEKLARTGRPSTRPALVLGSNAAVIDAVRQGLGPAVISTHVVGDLPGVHVVALPSEVRRRPLHAVWTRGRHLRPREARLVEATRDVAKPSPEGV